MPHLFNSHYLQRHSQPPTLSLLLQHCFYQTGPAMLLVVTGMSYWHSFPLPAPQGSISGLQEGEKQKALSLLSPYHVSPTSTQQPLQVTATSQPHLYA